MFAGKKIGILTSSYPQLFHGYCLAVWWVLEEGHLLPATHAPFYVDLNVLGACAMRLPWHWHGWLTWRAYGLKGSIAMYTYTPLSIPMYAYWYLYANIHICMHIYVCFTLHCVYIKMMLRAFQDARSFVMHAPCCLQLMPRFVMWHLKCKHVCM